MYLKAGKCGAWWNIFFSFLNSLKIFAIRWWKTHLKMHFENWFSSWFFFLVSGKYFHPHPINHQNRICKMVKKSAFATSTTSLSLHSTGKSGVMYSVRWISINLTFLSSKWLYFMFPLHLKRISASCCACDLSGSFIQMKEASSSLPFRRLVHFSLS